MTLTSRTWPGLRAPARLFLGAAFALLLAVPGFADAQQQPASQPPRQFAPPASARPVPSDLELAKLIWSTMAMVDHANRSGNYSVLRDNSATGFQINNDPAALGQIFSQLRATRIDLSNTLLLGPTYTAPPALVQADVFRVQGYFGLRPTAIAFDLYFQWEQGRWKLFGIDIQPLPLATIQPGGGAPAPAVQPQAPAPKPRRN